ncbi:MAG TPA: isoprenylcysteine carboxylmethyltransferase family protein [Gemmatimonadaceae bacterium]
MSRFTNAVVEFMVRRSRATHGPLHIGAAVLMGASLELVLVPVVLVMAGRWVDSALHLGPLVPGRGAPVLAAACFAVGVPWLASSIYWQHRRGGGTPLPLVPTKTLVTGGPYRFCRNPMALGAVFWLAGWALLANSATALYGGVAAFSAAIFSYHKLVEERELEARFGDVYRRYRETTPFLLPLARRNGRGSRGRR